MRKKKNAIEYVLKVFFSLAAALNKENKRHISFKLVHKKKEKKKKNPHPDGRLQLAYTSLSAR